MAIEHEHELPDTKELYENLWEQTSNDNIILFSLPVFTGSADYYKVEFRNEQKCPGPNVVYTGNINDTSLTTSYTNIGTDCDITTGSLTANTNTAISYTTRAQPTFQVDLHEAKEILRKVRKILRVGEGESIIRHAETIMQILDENNISAPERLTLKKIEPSVVHNWSDLVVGIEELRDDTVERFEKALKIVE